MNALKEYWNRGGKPAPHRTTRASTHTLVLSALFLTWTGCGKGPAVARSQWFTMGTVAAIQAQSMEEAKKGRELIQPVFERVNTLFSTWQETSELSLLNQTAGKSVSTPLSPDAATLVASALQIAEASDGAFNPLAGSLMSCWGFTQEQAPASFPSEEALQEARKLADWRRIQFYPTTTPVRLSLPQPGMKLDLGAIAKGYAVDLAYDTLTQGGTTNALIDLGGNLRAIGEASPRRGGWRTGVRNPFAEGSCAAQFLLTNGEAVATSGNYERFVEIANTRYAHIMDARTGRPVTGMAGVTAVAPTAMLADALSTTLFVLGPEAGVVFLKRYPGCEAIWIPDTPEKLTLLCTPGIVRRLTLLGKKNVLVRSLPNEARQ